MSRYSMMYIFLLNELYRQCYALTQLSPTVVIGILVRNKEFSLPFFFYYLGQLSYSTKRIGVIVYEDHSFDSSPNMVRLWCATNREKYAFVYCVYNVNMTTGYHGESFSTDWQQNRMDNVISLREKMLSESRRRWADYFFMVDADVILVNDNVLRILIDTLTKTRAPSVSPLLNFTNLPFYSNFWDGLSDDGSYIRSDRYLDIKERLLQGVFAVPLINTAILFDLNHLKSNFLSFKHAKHGSHGNDDLLNLAFNCKNNDIQLWINNEHLFGYSPGPLFSIQHGYTKEYDNFLDLKFKFLLYHDRERAEPLRYLEYLQGLKKDIRVHRDLNVDTTVVINLERRKNRNLMVDYMLKEMKVKHRFYSAIDGRNLTKEFLEQNRLSQLDGYLDPFHKRGLKFGEIGCFLSHFNLWESMIDGNVSRMLILEDDIHLKSDFVTVVNGLLEEADLLYPSWEFLYLGRKIMSSEKEKFVNGTTRLLFPNYSYRTTAYVLNKSGAQKLVNENPLQKLVALDEFIPIMYGKNPHAEWLRNFAGKGTLNAIATHPKIVEPSHFKGDREYVSDTELTEIAFL